MLRRSLTVLACLALLTSGAFAAGLDVNNGAALTGNFGLEVSSDGTTASAFLFDDTPANETTYRAEFQFDINDFAFASNSGPTSNFGLFKLWDLDQPGPLPRQHLTVGIRLGADGKRKVFAKIINFDGATSTPTWRNEALSPMEINLPDGAAGYPVNIRVEFVQATADTLDGVISLARSTAFDPATYVTKTHSQVDNDMLDVDRIQLGATAADADSTGSFFLDEFSSFRTLVSP